MKLPNTIPCFQTQFPVSKQVHSMAHAIYVYIMYIQTLMCSVHLMCEGGVEQVASLCVHDPLRLASGA